MQYEVSMIGNHYQIMQYQVISKTLARKKKHDKAVLRILTSSLREITRIYGQNIFGHLSSYAKLAKSNDAISRKRPKTSFWAQI